MDIFAAEFPIVKSNTILVTGAAGFIGFHLSSRLLSDGWEVVGLDNLNAYYDISLKKTRLDILLEKKGFRFLKADLSDRSAVENCFSEFEFDYVINLAAQAGVRYSLTNPYAYLDSNLTGFLNVLESCRHHQVKHLIYASSSSVYGANQAMPFSVHQNVDHPISLYAATKKANELMAHTYSVLYGLPATGLRFFTVYGPFGRPDMALFIFTKAILEGRAIDIYNYGRMRRDFTFVDDIVEGVSRLIPRVPTGDQHWSGKNPDAATSFAPYRVFNIGNNRPVQLLDFIEVLEEKLQKRAIKNYLPIQPGDVPETFADITALENEIGFRPSTSIESGIEKFVDWYKSYYKVN